MLKNNLSSKEIFKNYDLIIAHKKSLNIFQSINKSLPKVLKCNISRCGTCPILLTGPKFVVNNNLTLFPNKIINCRSKNLLYVLKCFHCEKWYIGETECELRIRVTLHRQHSRTNYGFSKLANHLKDCAKLHHEEPKFNLFPFYQNYQMSKTIRRQLENYFIQKYSPPLNATTS